VLTSALRRALQGPGGGACGGCIRHSAAAISRTDRAAPAAGREAERAPASPASRGHRTGGVSGGGCGVGGAAPRRAAAREGLWTRTRRARRREADPGRGGVAAATRGSGLAGGGGRRARWLPGRAMAGRCGWVAEVEALARGAERCRSGTRRE